MTKKSVAKYFIFFLFSCLTVQSANARCSTNFNDYHPQKVKAASRITAPLDKGPIVHQWMGDWFTGWVRLKDKTEKTGYKWEYGVWQEIEISGDFYEKSYAKLFITSNERKLGNRVNSVSMGLYIDENIARVKHIKMLFDKSYKYRYNYKKKGRRYKGKAWNFLNKKHISKQESGLYSLSWRISKDKWRFKKGNELILQVTKGFPKFDIAISIDGFIEVSKFLKKTNAAWNLYERRRSADKVKNYPTGYQNMKKAAEIWPGLFLPVYYNWLDSRLNIDNLTPEDLGIPEIDFMATVRSEITRDVKNYPSPGFWNVVGIFRSVRKYGSPDQEGAVAAYKTAAIYGEKWAHRNLFYRLYDLERYSEARYFGDKARTMGMNINQDSYNKAVAREFEPAIQCAWQIAYNAHDERLYNKLLNWYPNASIADSVRARLKLLGQEKVEADNQRREQDRMEAEIRAEREAKRQAKLAQDKKADRIWAVVSKSNNRVLLQKFIADFPGSKHVETAKWLLESMGEEGQAGQ